MKVKIREDHARTLLTLEPESRDDLHLLTKLHGPHPDTEVLLRPVSTIGSVDGETVTMLTFELVKIEPDDLK